MEANSTKTLHTIYFGKQRNYWWNEDFLKLMGKRWNIKNVQSVLDIGCGLGHWGRALKSILPETTRVLGIDKESSWVKEAQEISKANKLDHRYTYQVGDALNINFPNESFDMVTCQTVLIHVPDVQRVLSEMIRVLKLGGLLVAIEPNNISRSLVLSTLDLDNPVDEILDVARFWLICERGKKGLNEGYISIGDQLPGYLSSFGLKDIQVYISDKARPFYPPYDSEEQQAVINEIQEWSERHFWIWDRTQTERYYKAGGGDVALFDSYWKKALYRQNDRILEGIKTNTFSTAGGKLNYCISARKH
jgi:ubiquinone/menaquinone biosynthesis C-methylase UbiE